MKISRTQLKETVRAILNEMPMPSGGTPLEGYLQDRLGPEISGILMDAVARLMPEDQNRLQELANQMVVNEQCGNRNTEASMTPNYEVELEQVVMMLVQEGYDPQEIMSIVQETIDVAQYGMKMSGMPEMPAMEEAMSADDMRREMEKNMGLEPDSIKSGEQLKQAEKERKEKAAANPKKKVAPKPRSKKPYGGGSKYRPYGRST
jgi:hypothetical protein